MQWKRRQSVLRTRVRIGTGARPGRWAVAAWVVALLGSAALRASPPPAGGGVRGEEKKKADAEADADGKEGESSPFVSFEKALDELRSKYRPMLLLYDDGERGETDEEGGAGGGETPDDNGREPAERLPAAWRALLGESSLRRVLAPWLLVAITDRDLETRLPALPLSPLGKLKAKGKPAVQRPPGPPLAEVFGLTRGHAALVVVDFRGRVARRYVEGLPARHELAREIEAMRRADRRATALARKVEALLERSLYAYELGETRTAVQKLLPGVKPKTLEALDPVTRRYVTEVESLYRGEAEARFEAASRLETAKKYAEAMETLEALSRAYPFPDLIQKAGERRGHIFRKARIGL